MIREQRGPLQGPPHDYIVTLIVKFYTLIHNELKPLQGYVFMDHLLQLQRPGSHMTIWDNEILPKGYTIY